MLYITIYDITNDRIRGRIAKVLKNYGLTRIQYSAFIGDLKKHQLSSMKTRLQEIIHNKEPEEDERKNIHIFPLPQYSWKNKTIIDNTHPTETNKVSYKKQKQEKHPEVI